MTGKCPDCQACRGLADVIEFGNRIDVYEVCRARLPQVHLLHKALAPCKDACIRAVSLKGCNSFIYAAHGRVLERRWFHFSLLPVLCAASTLDLLLTDPLLNRPGRIRRHFRDTPRR